jgi:eukaryotic-like serine/threonine-protein kinase
MKIIWNAICYATWKGLCYGAGLGALYGTFLAPIAGTIYGLVLGGIIGNVLGVPAGLLVGWITHQFFTPPTNPSRYRWTIALTSAVFTDLGAIIGQILIYGLWTVSNFNGWSLVFFEIPALMAAAAATYAGLGFANRHIAQFSHESWEELTRTPSGMITDHR